MKRKKIITMLKKWFNNIMKKRIIYIMKKRSKIVIMLIRFSKIMKIRRKIIIKELNNQCMFNRIIIMKKKATVSYKK